AISSPAWQDIRALLAKVARDIPIHMSTSKKVHGRQRPVGLATRRITAYSSFCHDQKTRISVTRRSFRRGQHQGRRDVAGAPLVPPQPHERILFAELLKELFLTPGFAEAIDNDAVFVGMKLTVEPSAQRFRVDDLAVETEH